MTDTDRDRYESWRARAAHGGYCHGIGMLRSQGLLAALLDVARDEAAPCASIPKPALSAGRPGALFAAGIARVIRRHLRKAPSGDVSHA